jgi:NAD(P)-dependent dehydrogenase (short-subunit alcohol dehydrogenase family)
LKDKLCVVTGANTGIGLETARGLAARGARVVMTARNESKGSAAVDEVRQSTGNERVEMLQLDLASFASVRHAARELRERHPSIDVLINNAGLVLSERQDTEDGFEATFQINHLGPFLFTAELIDAVKRAAPARIINLASDAHRQSKGLDFSDLMRTKRSYSGFAAYCDSKLANILFTRELARRLDPSQVVVHAVHPGVVRTGFAQDGDVKGPFRLLVGLVRPFMITPEKGADTSLTVATSPEAAHTTGQYWAKNKPVTPSRHARDDAAARRLFEESERLTGVKLEAAAA